MKNPIIPAFFFLMTTCVFGQKKVWVGENHKIFNLEFHYTHVIPGGDFASRYGNFHGIGGGMLMKTKPNILYGAEASYYFGSTVKEPNLLFALSNNVGGINTNSGSPGAVDFSMRGFNTIVKGGYLLPVSKKNRNSGIVLMLGGGIVMHKIHIAVQNDNIPSLTSEKRKGYDRYSSGWAAKQFIGYYHQGLDRRYNFYLGFDLMQAVTYNRRRYNYDLMEYDTGSHNDTYWGIRFAWMIPVYINTKTSDDEFIYK